MKGGVWKQKIYLFFKFWLKLHPLCLMSVDKREVFLDKMMF